MFGPAKWRKQQSCTLEKIYGMLILQIRMRFGHLNYRDIKQLFHKGVGWEGVMSTPGPPPCYAPVNLPENERRLNFLWLCFIARKMKLK